MSLKGKKILLFVAEEYEDLELHYPRLKDLPDFCAAIIRFLEKK